MSGRLYKYTGELQWYAGMFITLKGVFKDGLVHQIEEVDITQ